MAGKFLKRGAIVNTVKGEQAANAARKRLGLTRHPITAHPCGCSDPDCGAFHLIRTDLTIPTAAEADATLAARTQARKASKQAGTAAKGKSGHKGKQS